MTVYWLTFRLENATIGGKTYEARYQALVDTLQKLTTRWWVKPTSFFAFESASSIENIAVACKRAIAPSHDLFLVREMDTKNALICGNNDDADIFALMPYLKKV